MDCPGCGQKTKYNVSLQRYSCRKCGCFWWPKDQPEVPALFRDDLNRQRERQETT